ncbi:MAG: thiamine phosphate synthase [Sphingomicrobium sp.]
MAANQSPWPREWLMTDERIGERLWEAIEGLPPGAGVVFRHHGTPAHERVTIARRVTDLCRERGLTLAISRDVALAELLSARLVHNPASDPGALPFSRSAHSLDEAGSGCNSGASLIFLSPLFPTRSHPGEEPLPREEARAIVAGCLVPVIALGGMSRARFEEVRRDGFYGWAGIDAWLGEGRSGS